MNKEVYLHFWYYTDEGDYHLYYSGKFRDVMIHLDDLMRSYSLSYQFEFSTQPAKGISLSKYVKLS
jgi:hypothetical protein